MALTELLSELDDELNKHGIFAKKVDMGRCIELFNRLKSELPQSIARSEEIVANRAKILENADTVAQNIIREAEARAALLTDNSEITKHAERRGREILDNTYRQCDTLIQKTKTHLDSMFSETENFFESILTLIRTNRNELRGVVLK